MKRALGLLSLGLALMLISSAGTWWAVAVLAERGAR